MTRNSRHSKRIGPDLAVVCTDRGTHRSRRTGWVVRDGARWALMRHGDGRTGMYPRCPTCRREWRPSARRLNRIAGALIAAGVFHVDMSDPLVS